MGESNLTLFPLDFNRSLRVEARPERLTAEAGAVLLREVVERLGVTRWLAERLTDTRDPELVTHPLVELLNTSLLLLGQGWRDQDDADTLRHDPILRLAVSTRRGVSPLERRPAPAAGTIATTFTFSSPAAASNRPRAARISSFRPTSEGRSSP